MKALGVLAQPREERTKCGERVEVTFRVITRHEAHVCLKTEPHDKHRCWCCTYTWHTT